MMCYSRFISLRLIAKVKETRGDSKLMTWYFAHKDSMRLEGTPMTIFLNFTLCIDLKA
jgi:hypothetical protein